MKHKITMSTFKAIMKRLEEGPEFRIFTIGGYTYTVSDTSYSIKRFANENFFDACNGEVVARYNIEKQNGRESKPKRAQARPRETAYTC
jgi:hypothetical protein